MRTYNFIKLENSCLYLNERETVISYIQKKPYYLMVQSPESNTKIPMKTNSLQCPGTGASVLLPNPEISILPCTVLT